MTLDAWNLDARSEEARARYDRVRKRIGPEQMCEDNQLTELVEAQQDLLEALMSEIATFHRTLESRASIDQAKGIVMSRSHCSPDEAFDVLVRASQRTNRKVRELAVEMVERAQQANTPG